MGALGPQHVVGKSEFVLQKPEGIHEIGAKRRQPVHCDRDVLPAGKGSLQGSILVRLSLARMRPGKGESERVHQSRREDVALLNRRILVCRAVISGPERNSRRTHQRSRIAYVPDEHGIVSGDGVIETPQIIVLFRGLAAHSNERADTAAQLSRGRRIQIDDRFNAWHGLSANSKRWNKGLERLVQMLAKAFVVEEEECLALLYRTADAASELIAPERSRLFQLKKIPGVQRVIAQKLVNGTMEHVRARPRHRVDGGSVATKLGAVGIRERLKFRDRFDSKGRACNGGTRSPLPPVLDVFAVQQNCVALGA